MIVSLIKIIIVNVLISNLQCTIVGFRFDPTAYTVTEGVDDVSLRVVKSGSTDIPGTVNVTTQPGTAKGWD